jgi:hypothetical protein
MATHYCDRMMEDLVADLDRVRAIADPAERAKELTRVVRQLPEIGAAIREARRQAVQELRQAGWSHQMVADLLGVHRNRAQQIAEGRSGGNRRPAQPDPDEL